MIFSALEVNESELVLVAVKRAGKGGEIVHAETIPRGEGGLAEALGKIPAPYRHGTLVVPRGQALLREFQVPAGSLEEIIQMVHFQMEREFPLPADQVRSSFSQGTKKEGKIAVQVAAVPNEILDPLLAELQKGGFRVDAVTVTTFGLARLVSAESEPVVLVGKSGAQAEILVSNRGNFSVSRTANISGDRDIKEAVKIEVERSVMAFQARSAGTDIDRVIVPVSWEDLGFKEAWTLDARISWNIGMASAFGVCLSGKGGLPDLLKPPVVVKKFRLQKMHRIAILAAVLLVGVLYFSLKLVSDREEELETLRDELKVLKPRVTHLKKKDRNLALSRTWERDGRFPWGEFLKALSETKVPAEKLYLLRADFEESGSVTISGKVRDGVTLGMFRKELEVLPFLRNVEPGPLSPRQDGAYQNDFSVKAWMVRAPD